MPPIPLCLDITQGHFLNGHITARNAWNLLWLAGKNCCQTPSSSEDSHLWTCWLLGVLLAEVYACFGLQTKSISWIGNGVSSLITFKRGSWSQCSLRNWLTARGMNQMQNLSCSHSLQWLVMFISNNGFTEITKARNISRPYFLVMAMTSAIYGQSAYLWNHHGLFVSSEVFPSRSLGHFWLR